MKKARLLVTRKCPRKCEGCCNEHIGGALIPEARKVTVEELFQYDKILITGGEPTLERELVYHLVNALRQNGYAGVIYLYTAWWIDGWFYEHLIHHIDGIHYTLHAEADHNDLMKFLDFQDFAESHRHLNKSFRLYIDNRVTFPVTVVPSLYKRVEVKAWKDMSNESLPEGEELLELIVTEPQK